MKTFREKTKFAWYPVRITGGRWIWWGIYRKIESLENKKWKVISKYLP